MLPAFKSATMSVIQIKFRSGVLRLSESAIFVVPFCPSTSIIK